MKLFAILTFLFSTVQVYASSRINLPAGGTATINAGETTIVTCEPSTNSHFCSCGGSNFGESYLVRVDFVSGQKIESNLGYYDSPENCRTILPNHISCK